MAGLEKALFNLKFTAKQLNRQSAKAGKDEQTERAKLKKAIQQNHSDIAKIYAQNAIRKQNERLNLLRLASRIDAVSSRVQTAVTMRQVTGSMANVVKGMDSAMKSMDLEKISAVMDKFETQFEDLDVATGYYENATSQATAVGTPQEDVDRLMSQVADEAGVELHQEMENATPAAKVGYWWAAGQLRSSCWRYETLATNRRNDAGRLGRLSGTCCPALFFLSIDGYQTRLTGGGSTVPARGALRCISAAPLVIVAHAQARTETGTRASPLLHLAALTLANRQPLALQTRFDLASARPSPTTTPHPPPAGSCSPPSSIPSTSGAPREMHRVQSFAKGHQFARALVSDNTPLTKLEDSTPNHASPGKSPGSAAGAPKDATGDDDKSDAKPPPASNLDSSLQPASSASTSSPQDTKEKGDGDTSITDNEKPPLGQRVKAGSLRFLSHSKDAIFHSWINVLLIFVPIGIAMGFAPLPEHIKPTIIFAMNAVAIIPLAGLLSHATEAVASKMGDTLASLLNVTFGNAVELIIFVIALVKNEIRIVQASILGSILANLLLILGMCFVFGGLRFQEQKYNSTVTQMSACLLSLSVMSLLLPTAFHAAFNNRELADAQTIKISRGTCVVLLLMYVLYLLFQLKSHSYLYESTPQRIIDEEYSVPGLLNEMLQSSSSSDTSDSSSTDSDSTRSSHNTTKNRIKRFVGRHRKDSISSSQSPPTNLTSPSLEMESVLEEPKNSPGASYFDATPRQPKEIQVEGIFSGDEADDDGPGAPRVRDFERQSSIKSDKSPEHKHKKRRRYKKHLKHRRHKKHDKDKDAYDEEAAVDGTEDLKEEKKAVAFVNMGATTEDDSEAPGRPTTKRQRTIRDVLVPNVFSKTVFSSEPLQHNILPISRHQPEYLHRSSSVPDRVGQGPVRGNTLNLSQSEPVRSGGTVAAQQEPGPVGLPEDTKKPEPAEMSRTAAVVLLLVSTGLVAFCAELLVDAIPDMIADTSVSQAFIGLIVLPIVGNAAEHVTAVTVATKNKMDLAIGVAVGSSIQIALFVTPFVVLLGWCLDRDMSLYFNIFETVSLFVTTFIINFLILDGRSNYLEGSLLCAAYVIIAIGAFFYPSQMQQSAVGGGNGSAGY